MPGDSPIAVLSLDYCRDNRCRRTHQDIEHFHPGIRGPKLELVNLRILSPYHLEAFLTLSPQTILCNTTHFRAHYHHYAPRHDLQRLPVHRFR